MRGFKYCLSLEVTRLVKQTTGENSLLSILSDSGLPSASQLKTIDALFGWPSCHMSLIKSVMTSDDLLVEVDVEDHNNGKAENRRGWGVCRRNELAFASESKDTTS